MTAPQDARLNADRRRWYIPKFKDCDNMNKTESKWERVEILRLYEKNRMHKRCAIVRGLKDEGTRLTQGMTDEIKVLQERITVILEDNQLSSFTDDKYSCNPTKHESLIQFDKVTDLNIQQILNGTFEGLVTD